MGTRLCGSSGRMCVKELDSALWKEVVYERHGSSMVKSHQRKGILEEHLLGGGMSLSLALMVRNRYIWLLSLFVGRLRTSFILGFSIMSF